MTGKCLSERRSVSSNSISTRYVQFSECFLNSASLLHNKSYAIQVYAKKDSSIMVCWGCRSSLKKGFRRQWIK